MNKIHRNWFRVARVRPRSKSFRHILVKTASTLPGNRMKYILEMSAEFFHFNLTESLYYVF